ncbi:MAG: type II secretion system protein [Bacilli bacterium]
MKKNNKKGFTLLEVLVSIIIIGIVLTCVVILTNASTEASSKSRLNNNISFKIEGLLDEFSVDPTSVSQGRLYYDELFTTNTNENTDYYIEIQIDTSSKSHYDVYTISMVPYVENEKYVLFGYESFQRTVRIER